MLGVRLGVVGILAREDVKVLTVYVDLSVICVGSYIEHPKKPSLFKEKKEKKEKEDATLLS
jgi:hypothetical protein